MINPLSGAVISPVAVRRQNLPSADRIEISKPGFHPELVGL
jgi:hypothetical protein